MPHFAFARFWFEGNRCSPLSNTLADFHRRAWHTGSAALPASRRTETELAVVAGAGATGEAGNRGAPLAEVLALARALEAPPVRGMSVYCGLPYAGSLSTGRGSLRIDHALIFLISASYIGFSDARAG